ncbi:MAG: flagellar motor protein MotD [Candidatus Pelagadaptatus aseana]|uniref:flagellar motor protein MotD n=1 Tax=Candidatus Pelagadaptatus aseana TaxID=3120508 RepID=UPI0039B2D738
MPRRRPVEISVNHERWLVSYADFITLLFAFFVVMYSISQVNESKYRVLSETMVDAFNVDKNRAINPIQVGDPTLSIDPNAIHLITEDMLEKGQGPEAGDGPFDKSADLPQLTGHFREEFTDLVDDEQILLHGNEMWLEIELKSSILFESGGTEPSLQAEAIFADIAEMLKPFNNPIQVEGFTDNVPINNSRFPSNWELSAARAAAIVRLLAEEGIPTRRLSAVGYGEHQPVADNATEEGRAKNRRVVLMITREKVDRPNVRTSEDIQQVIEPEDAFESSAPYPQPGLARGSDLEEVPLLDSRPDALGIESNDTDETADEEQSGDRLAPIGEIKPVETKQGGLLFTSDPDLPRN